MRWSTNEIDNAATGSLNERINTAGQGTPVVVYNPVGWERSGEVNVHTQAADGKAIDRTIHVDHVPAFGYKTIRLEAAGPAPANVRVSDAKDAISIENQNLKAVVSKQSGCIISLFDKHTQSETLTKDACANQLQFFKDTPKDYDAWNIDPGTLDVAPMTIDKADSVESFKNADGDSGILIKLHWQGSRFAQRIRLAADADFVDVCEQIDWHESHILLKAAFPVAVTSDHATYEIPYGSIERPTTRNTSWEKAQFEVPAMRWADLSGAGADGKVRGLSVINNSKYGYDAVGNLLRLTLLRSPKWPDPDADMGHHHFHYALYPHAGTWKDSETVRRGWEYNYPMTAVLTTAHAGTLPASQTFAGVDEKNVVVTAMKKAEDTKGLIFRMYEWAGATGPITLHVPAGAASATVTNMQETPEGSPLKIEGGVVHATIHPYEILTLRVDYPGAGPKQE